MDAPPAPLSTLSPSPVPTNSMVPVISLTATKYSMPATSSIQTKSLHSAGHSLADPLAGRLLRKRPLSLEITRPSVRVRVSASATIFLRLRRGQVISVPFSEMGLHVLLH